MRRRLLILVAALATALATAVPAGIAEEGDTGEFDQTAPVEKGEYDSYIVVMDEAPADDLIESHNEVLEDSGIDTDDKVHDYVNAVNGFSALITHEEAERLAQHNKVALVMPDELHQKTTDSSPSFLGMTGPGGAWASGYTGAGVVVGVIDTGIWPEHPSFADTGFPAPPIPALDESVQSACDFGNTAHNPDDAPFTCNNKLVGARQMLATYRALIGADPGEYDSARDDDGHGTHTASTAAGNADVPAVLYGEPYGVISGIAPDAHVIAYKGLGALGGFSSDLAAAIDQAVADGVDVINYSIGGGASLTGVDDIAFLFAADAGVFVATSAGNTGPGPNTVGGPGSVPWITTVGANTQRRFFEGEIKLRVLKDRAALTALLSDLSVNDQENAGHLVRSMGHSQFVRMTFEGASITPGTSWAPLIDAADAGNDQCLPGTLDPAVVAGNIVLCRRGASARSAKGATVAAAGGVGMIMYNNSDSDNLFTDSQLVPSVHIDYTPGTEIKDLLTADRVDMARIITGSTSNWSSAPSMTIFSSRGPNGVAPDIIKPDITAPGMQILAGNSPININSNSQQGELFQAIAGTSMSSPHVAGVYALLKQAHPDWSPAAAKSAIMTSSYQDVVDNDRSTPANPFAMGSGHLNPGGTEHGSAFNPGIVYDAGFFEYLGFLCDAEPTAFSDPAGTCGFLESIGVPTDASDLNYPSIGVAQLAGTQTVTRTVTSVANRTRTYTVSVDAPPGYDVVVSPTQLTLAPGESASYEVAITNLSAPVGEWRFGSLTWSTGRLGAYSPIALNASLFNAPDSVTGTGEDGNAAFDVSFGYTGSYTAGGHGLEPAIVTMDNVVQDPDQNFDPNDGFSNAHTFNLTGAAYFRVAIPPDAVDNPDIDLDVFVYDPSGVQVASSTLGGTDEEVNILLPDDGTWTVYVHGWQTVGASADYTMYSWAISLTPGGNLSIDSAPASAVLAQVETIDVSWTGATAGEWHLGAVSHTGDVGLMGLTLVEVDNR